MLDTDTKRRIDTARDILVGKVPDPKSQVEQITIALIYKFMDDMDAEAEELGGHRKFFTEDFQRYGWAKLMRSGLGGHELLGLYAEGITKMPENPGIPLLFRDIFKNAYLPYRDPETLKSFLKVIDEFSYDHSERLGDAFEYLLSVLGSQGDAGQFRTPRHIIDFIVALLDPKRHETVLDPACGTAGFLISSYKHILKANTNAEGHSTLTPDERGRLAANIRGYDISPDMVRLSLVNLYLHGFTDPHIDEYDTLTSEDKWNESFDLILANPPFMSPKGGIKPHRRFSVQSKRSEVLFVDYIAEHLTPTGRAGIIVPEGVIFQCQTAYAQLRKMLVEEYLVAVISLPAGIFQPYSGVKTSILLLDKSLARRSDTVGFFKVENDGFGLGAQRRAIEKNDLPQVQAEVGRYLTALRAQEEFDGESLTSGQLVSKEKLAANQDYNLSGERYREGVINQSTWPLVSVSEAFQKGERSVMPGTLEGPVTYIGLENLTQVTGEITGEVVTEKPADIKSLKNVFKPRDILYGKLRPNLNKVWLADRRGICSTDIFVIEAKEGRANPALFAYIFRSRRFNDAVMAQIKGAQLPRIGWSSFAELEIPLPPLEVQKEIVAEIEIYQKVINGARAVLDHYRPHIPIHPDWPLVELGTLFQTKSGTTPPRSNSAYFDDGTISWVKTLDLVDGPITTTEEKITSLALDETHLTILPVGTVLVAMYGGFNQIGRTGVLEIEATHNQAMTALLPSPDVSPYFLNAVLVASKEYWKSVANSTRKDPNITKSDVLAFKLPLPPLSTQQAIVSGIEAEQALVNANKELISRMESKIQATLARIWGEDQTKENVLAEFPTDPSADLPMAAEQPPQYGGKPR